jgi:phosphohistidine phosphatase SixA
VTARHGTATDLFLLRHADAGDPASWKGDDDERPLSPKGHGQAERLGRFLAAAGVRPDVIRSSPKVRALETAGIVAGMLGLPVTVDERLSEDADLDALEAVLRDVDAKAPMLVGHDPDFSAAVALLCGATRIPLRKGALARLDVERPLRAGGGALRVLLPPALLSRWGREEP